MAVPVNVEAGFCCVIILSIEVRKQTPMVMGCIDLQHHVDGYSLVNFYTVVIQKMKTFFLG